MVAAAIVLDIGEERAASRNVGRTKTNRSIPANRSWPASAVVIVVEDLEGRVVLSRDIPAEINGDVSAGADAAAVIQDSEKCLGGRGEVTGDTAG